MFTPVGFLYDLIMKIPRFLLLIGFCVVTSLLTFCSKEEMEADKDIHYIQIDRPGHPSDRLIPINKPIPLRTEKNGSILTGEDLVFIEKYAVEGPVVDGFLVQASHIFFHDQRIYLSYNTAGEEVRGGFEMIDLNDPDNPQVYATGTPEAEYSSLEVYYHPVMGKAYLILGGCRETLDEGHIAEVRLFGLDASGIPVLNPTVFDLEGYVTTDVNHLGVVTGTSGGYYQIDPNTMNNLMQLQKLDDARSIAFHTPDQSYISLLGSPGRIVTGLPNSPSTLLLGGLSNPGNKATIRLAEGYAFAALGEGGLKVVDLSTRRVTASLPRPEAPDGENSDDYVTNGVSINEAGQVFIANGAAGITVAKLKPEGQLEILGYLDLETSVNFVEAHGEFLFAACGIHGVAIIQVKGLLPGDLVISTSGIEAGSLRATSAVSGGVIVAGSGRYVESRGVCWSTKSNPTIYNQRSINGSGSGTFSSTMRDLTPQTTYYVRAFATTSTGTLYGNEVDFTTPMLQEGSQVFTDTRDGHIYKWVQIGDQIWMAENLAWMPSVSPQASGSQTEPYHYVYQYSGYSVPAAKSKTKYHMYGVLYNWEAAQIACPPDWHIPSDQEWNTLEQSLGMDPLDIEKKRFRYSGEVGKKLRSSFGWYHQRNGNDMSGFHALPAGYRARGGNYLYEGSYTAFWTSNSTETQAWYRGLYYFNAGVYRDLFYKSGAFSVRCVKN